MRLRVYGAMKPAPNLKRHSGFYFRQAVWKVKSQRCVKPTIDAAADFGWLLGRRHDAGVVMSDFVKMSGWRSRQRV